MYCAKSRKVRAVRPPTPTLGVMTTKRARPLASLGKMNGVGENKKDNSFQ
uniref:Uncharacterized protein n=2 Tax=unclassified Kuttervirus TaxID=2770329 RepID=A0AAU8GIE6_9CAUD